MHSLNAFASSFVSIFIPIYLLALEYSLTSVFLFLSVHHIFVIVGSFLAIAIANRVGLQNVLKIRFVFLALYLISLALLQLGYSEIFLVAIIGGLNTSLYWTPLNILFSTNAPKEKLGTAMGKFIAFPKLVSILGPFFAGVIAAYFGFLWLFLIVFILALLAFIPIISLKSRPTSFNFTFSQAREMFSKHRYFFFSEIFDHFIEDTLYVVWPIFVYTSVLSFIDLGIVGSLIGLGAVLFNLFVGKKSDGSSRLFLVRLGAILVIPLFLLMYGASSNELLFVFSFVTPFVMALFLVPYSTFLLERSKEDPVHFFVFREIPVVLGRLLAFGTAILSLYFVQDIRPVFLVAAAFLLFFVFFRKPKQT